MSQQWKLMNTEREIGEKTETLHIWKDNVVLTDQLRNVN